MRLLHALALVVALAASLAFAPSALAADVIKLRDGSTLTGEIVKETDSYLYIRVKIGSIEQERFVLVSDIVELTRDAIDSEAEEAEAQRRAETEEDEPAAIVSDTATRVAFLQTSIMANGSDMVGPYLNGTQMSRSVRSWLAMPENERPEVVVLIIDSGGGAVAELDAIIQAIHVEMKEHFRTVAWIREAYSGAAFTAMNCNEIVFMTDGAMGGNVMFSGGGVAGTGEAFQEMLEYGRQVAANGNISPYVMWAMQMFMVLTADKDPETGEVTWYNTDEGEYMVSPENEVLTLNAFQAERFNIAKGIADTKHELMDVLAIEEWREVAQDVNEDYIDFLDGVKTAENRIVEFWNKMGIAVDIANSTNNERELRQQVRIAQRHLASIRSLARRAPSLEKYWFSAGVPPLNGHIPLTREWFRAVDEMIKSAEDRIPD